MAVSDEGGAFRRQKKIGELTRAKKGPSKAWCYILATSSHNKPQEGPIRPKPGLF